MAAPATKQFKYRTITIDCTVPYEAGIFDTAAFLEHLCTTFKPTRGAKAGKVGRFDPKATKAQNEAAIGQSVIISSNEAQTKVYVYTKTPLSKAYVKFLTKKFLKRHELRDLVRVTAPTQKNIALKFYNTSDE